MRKKATSYSTLDTNKEEHYVLAEFIVESDSYVIFRINGNNIHVPKSKLGKDDYKKKPYKIDINSLE